MDSGSFRFWTYRGNDEGAGWCLIHTRTARGCTYCPMHYLETALIIINPISSFNPNTLSATWKWTTATTELSSAQSWPGTSQPLLTKSMMNLLVLWETSSQRSAKVRPIYICKTCRWFMSSVEWVKVSILPTVQRIICRTSSRVLVGAPLCA